MTELEKLRSGNREFIEIVYKGTFKTIQSWIKKNSGSESEAEDVFQEALISVYQKSKDENFTLNCKLSTFLFSVAKNIWLHTLRTRDRYVFTDGIVMEDLPVADEQNVEKTVENAEIDRVYRRNFEKLTVECKKILTYFFNGLSMDEIVKTMNLSNSNVARKKKFRCKIELVKLVESDPLYDELTQIL